MELAELPEYRDFVAKLTFFARGLGEEARRVVVHGAGVTAVNEAAVEGRPGCVRVSLHQLEDLAYASGYHQVVRAEQPAPPCLRELYRGQEVRGKTVILGEAAVPQAPADALTECLRDLRCVVHRRVVRNADLDPFVAHHLGGDGVEHTAQLRRATIVGGYADGEEHSGSMPRCRGYARGVNLSQKVAFNTTVLLASRVVVAASGLAGVAVSTRYLGPADFGQLTIAIVLVSVFGFFTDAGLYTVAAREIAKRPDEERRILSNVFAMGLVASVGAVILALLVAVAAYGAPADDLVRLGVVILSVQMLAAALGGTASAYLVAHQRAAPTALAATASSLVFVVLLLLTVELDFGFAGLAACFAVSGLISLLLPVIALRGIRLSLARDIQLWREMLAWALPQAGVLVLGVIYFRLDTFLLSFLSSDGEVGRYGVAYRVLEVLIVVPIYLMSTLFPEIARQRPHSARLNEIVQGAFSSAGLAAVPLLIIFVVFAEEVVGVAGGPAYISAAPVVRYLALAVALLFLNTVFFQSLVALNRQGNLFVLLLAVLVGNVLLNLILIPALGAVGAAISLVISEAVALVLCFRLYRQVGAVPGLRRPFRLTLAAAATAAVVVVLREVLPLDRPDAGLGTSFTAAVEPLATLVAASILTVGLWGGALTLLDAVPVELRAAFGALRQRSTQEPVAVPPPVSP